MNGMKASQNMADWLAGGCRLRGTVICFIAAVFALLVTVTGQAADSPLWIDRESNRDRVETGPAALNPTSGLREYLVYAMWHNDGLRAAFAQWRAAMQAIPQATSLPDPVLSYAYYATEVETRVGPQEQRISLSQRFPWFGKLRLKGDVAAKQAEATWLDYQAARLALAVRVSTLYYDYAYLKRAIEITRENFDLMKSLEQVARERYRTGESMTAVTQAQVELGKLQDRLRSLNELRPALSSRLSAALGRRNEDVLPWPASMPSEIPAVNDAEFLSAIESGNAALLRLGVVIEREEVARELAEKRKWPDITVGLTTIDTGSAVMPGVDESGRNPLMLTVALNLPIWRGAYRAAAAEATWRRQASVNARQDTTQQLIAKGKMLLYRFKDADRKIDLYRDTLVPKARQSLSVARQAFQTGTSDFQAVIDAQRALLEFQLEHERASAERGKQFAALNALRGAGLIETPAAEDRHVKNHIE